MTDARFEDGAERALRLRAETPEDLAVISALTQDALAEVKDAAQKGTLVEFFGTGTAAVISPVDRIGYLGEDLHLPTGPDGMGPVSRPLWKHLTGIQTGSIAHPWSVEV